MFLNFLNRPLAYFGGWTRWQQSTTTPPSAFLSTRARRFNCAWLCLPYGLISPEAPASSILLGLMSGLQQLQTKAETRPLLRQQPWRGPVDGRDGRDGLERRGRMC